MSMHQYTGRVELTQVRSNAGAPDDHIVLRLSRDSLKADPPAIRFLPRTTGSPGQPPLPWSA